MVVRDEGLVDESGGLVMSFDVAIIGSGLAVTTCAAALHRRGYGVALIDARARHPSEFRGEKVSPAAGWSR